jgi:hypothetical protein
VISVVFLRTLNFRNYYNVIRDGVSIGEASVDLNDLTDQALSKNRR